MRFFYQVLVTVALLACVVLGAPPLAPGVYVGPEFGGPHGYHYSDVDKVRSGHKVTAVTLHTGDRVDSVQLDFMGQDGKMDFFHHGGKGGEKKILWLVEGEYITNIEVHWGKHRRHTRVVYMKFTTNLGNTLEGGRTTDNVGTDSAKEGYQLGGFVGRSGNELDMVGAIWSKIDKVGDDSDDSDDNSDSKDVI
ncbi:Hypothetical protein PHPALM_3808 [Phytophthora palmivora]|uniref:Jacalin-type lectin domain-containing protein n=1 Tax=Phytophthora palmivora TaxID=4796 RepID=A0A2P4YLM0_9STRA|nr:Hypothetical protein PHPALM_3808 [Phytophthora palmivora]